MTIEKNISLSADNVTITATVLRATFGTKLQRDLLINRSLDNAVYENEAERIIATVLHPRAVTCVAPGGVIVYEDGDTKRPQDLTTAEFSELPSRIVEAWLDAVWEVNPSWDPSHKSEDEKTTDDEDAKKKS